MSVKTYSAKHFYHDVQEKLLVGEASSLQLEFGRLYADAYDIGLALYNPVSELTSYWYLVDTCVSGGDTQYWDLKPCNPTNDSQRQYTMRIFND